MGGQNTYANYEIPTAEHTLDISAITDLMERLENEEDLLGTPTEVCLALKFTFLQLTLQF